MMIQVNFSVILATEQQWAYGPVLTKSQFLNFGKFWNFGFDSGVPYYAAGVEDTPSIIVSCAPDHPRLPAALKMLESYGWTAYDGFVPPELRHSHFTLRIARLWDEADLDPAPLLRLAAWGSNQGPLV